VLCFLHVLHELVPVIGLVNFFVLQYLCEGDASHVGVVAGLVVVGAEVGTHVRREVAVKAELENVFQALVSLASFVDLAQARLSKVVGVVGEDLGVIGLWKSAIPFLCKSLISLIRVGKWSYKLIVYVEKIV